MASSAKPGRIVIQVSGFSIMLRTVVDVMLVEPSPLQTHGANTIAVPQIMAVIEMPWGIPGGTRGPNRLSYSSLGSGSSAIDIYDHPTSRKSPPVVRPRCEGPFGGRRSRGTRVLQETRPAGSRRAIRP